MRSVHRKPAAFFWSAVELIHHPLFAFAYYPFHLEYERFVDYRRAMRIPRLLSIPLILIVIFLPLGGHVSADESLVTLRSGIDSGAKAVEKDVIAWRRQFHHNPELSNREFKTAERVAAHLTALGMQVQTEVAHTGVIGLLEGGRPGPVVALRADMDALPVTEETGLPFASTVRSEYEGQDVGVMHACGHDMHTAILMGVATVLSGMRDELPGTVKFIFQPAEEGAPRDEEGGADMMVAEGALKNPEPSAIFGLHVIPGWDVGEIAFRPGGMMASSDRLVITVHGQQTHGAKPWLGVDPIVVSAQIINALQTVVSRQSNVTLAPAVVTIGSIHGGTRFNIIPDDVEMRGTIRTFDESMRADILESVRRIVASTAESAGATAEVSIFDRNPVTYNDPDLTAKMTPTLQRVVGRDKAVETLPQTWAEDFAFYQQEIPGLYIYLGVRTPGAAPESFPTNHSPHFIVDEDVIIVIKRDFMGG